MTECEIGFENNPMKVIYAGQLVRGLVRLYFKKEKRIRGIYIHIFGKAYATWTKYCRHFESYSGKEEYFNDLEYFLGAGRCSETQSSEKLPKIFKMSSGTHKYTFECMLPTDLPTSVEGKHGHIRYIARVVINTIYSGRKIFDFPFTVLKPVDLNADPKLRVINDTNFYS